MLLLFSSYYTLTEAVLVIFYCDALVDFLLGHLLVLLNDLTFACVHAIAHKDMKP